MAKWRITLLDAEAAEEAASFFEGRKPIKDEVYRLLKMLAAEDDPRDPKDRDNLDVSELVDDAPGWFRLSIHRYAVRVVFRVMIVRGKRLLDIGNLHVEGEMSGTIDIVRTAHRDQDPYGRILRSRYRRLTRK